MTSALPCRLAISMCARNDASCTPRPSSPGPEVVQPRLPDGPHHAGRRRARRSRRARRRASPRRRAAAPRSGAARRRPPARRTAAPSRPPTGRPGRSQPIWTMRGTPTAAEAASASSTDEPVLGRVGDVEVAVQSATGTRSGSGAGGRSRGPATRPLRARVGPSRASRLLGLLDAREQRLALGDRSPGRQLAPSAGVLHPLRRRADRAPPRRRADCQRTVVAFGITGCSSTATTRSASAVAYRMRSRSAARDSSFATFHGSCSVT